LRNEEEREMKKRDEELLMVYAKGYIIGGLLVIPLVLLAFCSLVHAESRETPITERMGSTRDR
jgi:hypothetical protein